MSVIRDLLSSAHLLILYALCAAGYMLRQYLRVRRHRAACFLIGTGSGIAALLLLHAFGGACGFALPLTLFHLSVSAVGGIPGVLLLLAMHMLEI